MKILVNYPTRGRLNKFLNNIGIWISRASNQHEITYLVKIDQDDKIMNNDNAKNLISSYLTKDHSNQKVEIRVLDTNTKIQAINACVSEFDFDIVICAADDIFPVVSNWDAEVAQDAKLDSEVCINYNIDDRTQNFRDLIIMPIFTKKLHDRMKHIYHPSYRSEYCDNEQTEVLAQLGLINHINKRPFFHDWFNNQDALMKRNIEIGNKYDRANFQSRKACGFPS